MGGALLMVEEREAYETQEGESYYTPDRVDYWLCHWRELLQLAMPTAPAVRYDATLAQHTPGRRPADPTRYVDVVADLERAWVSLGCLSLEFKAVECTMQGWPLREIERIYRLRHGTAYEAYERAKERMARHLGWRG